MIHSRMQAKQNILIRSLKLRRWLRRTLTPRAKCVAPIRVSGTLPSSLGNICLFVSYTPTGQFSKHVQKYMEALSQHGFIVIAIAAVDNISIPIDLKTCKPAKLVLKRKNVGFDFAAWAATLEHYPDLWGANKILFVNDSVYALLGHKFNKMMDRISNSETDVQAIVESRHRGRHFQSYFFCMKRSALDKVRVKKFWTNVKNFKNKEYVINTYEIKQLKMLENSGLSVDILHHYRPEYAQNPTFFYWKGLINEGFPFIKVQLLRNSNDAEFILGWPEVVLSAGGDITPIEQHLNEAAPNGPALRILQDWKDQI